MAQIMRVTSEALQATIRRLLPSQQGFGEDLQASNVIQPIIDLTPSAEGSELGVNLQTALAFGSQTAFTATSLSGEVTLANSAGFWRVTAGIVHGGNDAQVVNAEFVLNDGTTDKIVWSTRTTAFVNGRFGLNFDYVFFLRSGDSLKCTAEFDCSIVGSYRQIADVNGALVNPAGFTSQ